MSMVSTKPFLFDSMRQDILIKISSVEHSIHIMEQILHDRPELLFSRMSLEDNGHAPIIVKINEHKHELSILRGKLVYIDSLISGLANSRSNTNVSNLIGTLDKFHI